MARDKFRLWTSDEIRSTLTVMWMTLMNDPRRREVVELLAIAFNVSLPTETPAAPGAGEYDVPGERWVRRE